MGSKVFGKCKIKAPNGLLDTKPGASCDLGGEKRTPNNTDNRAGGYTSEIVNSLIDCEVALREGESVESMRFTDGTVIFEADTGQRYLIKDAYTTDPPKLTGGQGVRLQIAGEPAVEMVS